MRSNELSEEFSRIPVYYRQERTLLPIANNIGEIQRLVETRMRPAFSCLEVMMDNSNNYVFAWVAIEVEDDDNPTHTAIATAASQIAKLTGSDGDGELEKILQADVQVSPYQVLFLLETDPVTIDYGTPGDRLYEKTYIIGPAAIPLADFDQSPIHQGGTDEEEKPQALLFLPGAIAVDIHAFLDPTELTELMSKVSVRPEDLTLPVPEAFDSISDWLSAARSDNELLSRIIATQTTSEFLIKILRRLFPSDFFTDPRKTQF